MSTNTRSKMGFTTSEAARRLGVSLSTIRRWSDMGHLRGYRTPGGQRRFSAQQLDEFLASLEAGADSRPSGGGEAAVRDHRHHEEATVTALYDVGALVERDPSPAQWPPVNPV